MSCSGTSDCSCGCCSGASAQTPVTEQNRPGLDAIAYRAGTWATFRESMRARLSSSDYPALAGLRVRTTDDFSIALLDASALVMDILTFYQERLANESYLRTATQLRSLVELSRLIGYVPAPGVAASTYLAFTLKSTPGLPANPGASAITIPRGTQVQSVPAQGQQPQTFETSADLPAKPDWNSMPVMAAEPWMPQSDETAIYLEGVATQLNPGDVLLILGNERITNSADPHWNTRIVTSVTADTANQRTLVTWNLALGHEWSSPPGALAQDNPKVFVFRQRAALFGYNAIDPSLINPTGTAIGGKLHPGGSPPFPEWDKYWLSTTIDLDAVYPKIVPQSWVALISSDGAISDSNDSALAAKVSLFQVLAVTVTTRSDFAMSAKISRVTPDVTAVLPGFHLQTTAALVQSEELAVAAQPLVYPLYGSTLDMADLRTDLGGLQVVAISGNRQKIAVADSGAGLIFVPADGSDSGQTLKPGDTFTLTDPTGLPTENGAVSATDWESASPTYLLLVEDANGRQGKIANAALNQFTRAHSGQTDPVVSEYALIATLGVGSALSPYPHSQLQLQSALKYCYDRSTATVNANVVAATQGQSVTEILGSGSASTPNQSFVLKQSPLTYLCPSGSAVSQSTLQVTVNSVPWTEVPTLYEQGPGSPVFTTFIQADQSADIIFGDGVEGAVLPTGQNNILANYRVGAGMAGNVAAGTLTTLMDRPVGVSGVTNPQATVGGTNAQTNDEIRPAAPTTTLTLKRAVSITDYQNIAANYPGIAKASAVWIPLGLGLGVFITVAASDGNALDDPTRQSLHDALVACGNPNVPVSVNDCTKTPFVFQAAVKYDGDPAPETAFQAVADAFSFNARSFGQCVAPDEIAAIIQSVAGVIAVNVTNLQRSDLSSTSGSTQPPPLCAALPIPNPIAPPLPAEILYLDPNLTAACLSLMS